MHLENHDVAGYWWWRSDEVLHLRNLFHALFFMIRAHQPTIAVIYLNQTSAFVFALWCDRFSILLAKLRRNYRFELHKREDVFFCDCAQKATYVSWSITIFIRFLQQTQLWEKGAYIPAAISFLIINWVHGYSWASIQSRGAYAILYNSIQIQISLTPAPYFV